MAVNIYIYVYIHIYRLERTVENDRIVVQSPKGGTVQHGRYVIYLKHNITVVSLVFLFLSPPSLSLTIDWDEPSKTIELSLRARNVGRSSIGNTSSVANLDTIYIERYGSAQIHVYMYTYINWDAPSKTIELSFSARNVGRSSMGNISSVANLDTIYRERWQCTHKCIYVYIYKLGRTVQNNRIVVTWGGPA